MSLMPMSRFMSDSMRSPSVAETTSSAPVSTPAHHGPCSRKTTPSAPATMPVTREPAKPSQDFLGLIVGAIGCLPASTPAV